MTPEKLMVIRRFQLFAPTFVTIPVSMRTIRITSRGSADFAWRELRIFGVLVAMWGAIG